MRHLRSATDARRSADRGPRRAPCPWWRRSGQPPRCAPVVQLAARRHGTAMRSPSTAGTVSGVETVHVEDRSMNSLSVCSVSGCERVANRPRKGWCEMHYGRWRRNGDPERLLLDGSARTKHSHGYVKVHRRGHPIADSSGSVYEHRLVMWEALQGQDAPCHWCAAPVRWAAGRHDADRLEIDHLGRKDDNNLDNIVVSCHACNTARAMAGETPEHRAERTRALRASRTPLGPRVARTCPWCQRSRMVLPSERRRFCSLSCSAHAREARRRAA